MSQNPVNLSFGTTIQTILSEKNIKNFNSNWSFKPVELVGKFDYSKEVFVKTYKNGIKGYEIITPFYFYNENNSNEFATIYVDRGFIEKKGELNHLHHHNHPGFTAIKGVLTMVHKNKVDKENDYIGKKLYTVNLEEFALFKDVKNLCSKEVLLKEVDFDSSNANVFPTTDNPDSLMKFSISDEKHTNIKRLYTALSFSLVFYNMYFWVCL